MIITQSLNIEKVSFGVVTDLWRNSCSNDLGPVSCASLFSSAWSACCIVLCCMHQGPLSSVVTFRYPLIWLVSFQDACSPGLCGLFYNLLSSVYEKYLPKKEKNTWVSLWYNSYDFFTVRELTNWLTDWISDSTVQGLTNWLNDLWLVDWQNNSLLMLLSELTIGANYLWLVDWLSDWLTLLSGDWPTDWMVYGWLIDWLTDATVWRLTNMVNDL